MNILHITTYLQGGAGRVIHDLAIAQKKRSHSVLVATSKTEYPGYCNYPEYLNGLAENQIPLSQIDSFFKRDAASFKAAKAFLADTLHRSPPDLIHCHASMPALAALEAIQASGANRPIIQTMHGIGANKTPHQIAQDIATMERLSKVVAVSETAKAQLIAHGLSPQKVTAIGNFVSARSSPSEDDPDFIALKSRPKNLKRIGCIGSLCERKNQALVIEALSLIRDDPSAPKRFVFIGEGPILENLQNRLREIAPSHRVSFLGYKANADRYLPLFDILLLPSLAEGMPLSLIEAFRERVPVICSDIPEHRELVRHQENGYLFASNSAPSLAAAIEAALSDPASEQQTLTENAFQQYQANHTMENVGQRYLSLYHSLLNTS